MAERLPERMRQLRNIIARRRPRYILEVGTCRGITAEYLIGLARQHRQDVHYHGFDLFAVPPPYEHSPRCPPDALELVRERLARTGAEIRLVAGDTRETLATAAERLPTMDLILVDGGHSLETIRSDWTALQPLIGPETVVVLDDHWNTDAAGCRPLVETLAADGRWRVEILPVPGRRHDGTVIHMVQVTRR